MARLQSYKKDLENQTTLSSQTSNNIDTPYSILEPLPPIFGSKVCTLTKCVFIAKSLPNVSAVVMVECTEDDLILEAAKEALSQQYEDEIKSFYQEARKRALELQQDYNQTWWNGTLLDQLMIHHLLSLNEIYTSIIKKNWIWIHLGFKVVK